MPAGCRRGCGGDFARRLDGLVPHNVDGLSAWRVRGLWNRNGRGDLLTAEPPVVFVRVARPVFEAPIRRGFAFSHIPMLTLSCSAVVNQARSTFARRIELLVSQRFSTRSVSADGVYCAFTLCSEGAQRLPKLDGGGQCVARSVWPAEMQ